MMKINNLTVGYGHSKILTQINGELKKGELVALMGVNGVGKSCLLKSIGQIIPALAGNVTIDDKEIILFSKNELAKKIAVVLTEKVHVDYLRVREFLEMGRSPYTGYWGNLTPDDQKIIREVVSLLKINSLLDSYYSVLSDGQKQKILLARALIQGPSYLILDEPTTYLDIPSKIDLMETLKFLSKEKNIAIFFSSHDFSLLENAVDSIWLIDNQKKLHKKSPDEMKQSGLFKDNFNLTF